MADSRSHWVDAGLHQVGVNYQTLLMMLADAPRYIDGGQASAMTTKKEQNNWPKSVIGFFQSKLNDDGQ